MDLNTLLSHVKDMSLEQILLKEASDNQIVVYKLPGGNLAVPLLGLVKDQYMTDFVHLRDQKCSVEECTKKKSKLHSLVVKGSHLFRHTLLGNYFLNFRYFLILFQANDS